MQKLEITMRDCKQYSVEQDTAFSQKLIPTREKIEARFGELASDFWGGKRVAEVIETVANLDKLDNIRRLMERLRK